MKQLIIATNEKRREIKLCGKSRHLTGSEGYRFTSLLRLLEEKIPSVLSLLRCAAPNHFYYVKDWFDQTRSNKKYRLQESVFFIWWGWLESNQLPSGYEPPALTDELQPHIFEYYSLFWVVELQ